MHINKIFRDKRNFSKDCKEIILTDYHIQMVSIDTQNNLENYKMIHMNTFNLGNNYVNVTT